MPATLNTLSFFVNRTRQIYTLPVVALEVLELTDHPRVDCRKLKQCIEIDPALVGKILRVVNSSLFGLGRDVTDLNQALALLGMKSLKLLVLGFSLSEAIFRGKTSEAMQHAWRHTLTRAVAARELCETVWHVAGDEAFTASLLAELGKFVLLNELAEPYTKLLSAAVKSHDDLYRLEHASLGFDHADLSAEVLSHWNLPESLCCAARLSSKPERIAMLERPELLLPAAVYLAGLVADLVVDDRHDRFQELVRDRGDMGNPLTEFETLRLSHDSLEPLVERVQQRVDSLAAALSFELPPGNDYRDVLVAAHERLAQLAGDAACAVARQWPIAERAGAEVAGVSTAVACYVNRYAEIAETIRPRPLYAAASRANAPARSGAEGERPHPQDAESAGSSPETRLLGRLATVVEICRKVRRPLSLLILELHPLRNLPLTLGAEEMKNLLRRLHAAARDVDHPGGVCVQLADAKFALVIADCDRRAAVAIGQQLVRGMPAIAAGALDVAGAPSLSVGVASVSSPSKNFPPEDLLRAATRCLDAAELSGGNTLKSIDVY